MKSGLQLALVVCAVAALAACAGRRAPAPVIERLPGAQAPARPVAQPGPLSPDGFYTVRRGDTLYSIALDHGADYRDMAQWNGIDDPSKLRVGQQLRVRAPEERVAAGVQVAPARGAGRIESRPLAQDGVKTEPKAVRVPYSREAVAAADPKAGAKPEAKPDARPEAGDAEFIWPVKGKVLTAFAEPRSKGIDIDGKPGEPIVAAAAGRVTYIGSGIPGLGKLVVIKHDNGFITVYAHNREIVVKEQQAVARGQKIAELGSSDSERPKLHFQIRKGAAAVDPLKYLPSS